MPKFNEKWLKGSYSKLPEINMEIYNLATKNDKNDKNDNDNDKNQLNISNA